MGLGKAGHKGKGNAWENGVYRLGLGLGVWVGSNIGAFIWVSQLGLLIGLGFKDLPDGLVRGLMVSFG